MSTEMEFVRLNPHDRQQLERYFELYESLFPEWELEPRDIVTERHLLGDYFSYVTSDEHGLLAFYTINLVPQLGYSLLNFMGVRAGEQGKGIGRYVLDHIKKHFRDEHEEIKYLIIEAEERPKRFYIRHKIRVIKADYKIPSFDDDHLLIDMNLLVYTEDIQQEEMPAVALRNIISHILTYGYDLDPHDKRIALCFDWNEEFFPIQ